VAIIGRITARQRLRKAAREALAIPAFSTPTDCTPWVLGGLWPAELSTITAETATLATELDADLASMAACANDQLKIIKRAGLTDSARRAQETRLIDGARARAERRVESTIRHLHAITVHPTTAHPRPPADKPPLGPTQNVTQIMPAVPAEGPAREEPTATSPLPPPRTATQPGDTAVAGPPAAAVPEPRAPITPHQTSTQEHTADAVTRPTAQPVASPAPAPENVANPELRSQQLQHLLAFVVQQEPGLNWAIGDQADGTTVLVTDLAHGWIPPGITLPAGVQLLEPQRRPGTISVLLGEQTQAKTYSPGDPVDHSADIAAMQSSVHPRALPVVNDLGWELGRATHWRDGLPRIVHTLARAAAARTGILEEEAELLQGHLEIARYQLLTEYPNTDPALLNNYLLLAATEAFVAQDPISANYHLAWFRKLNNPR
jgi:hypothetical protein